jgi:hypothetical protein
MAALYPTLALGKLLQVDHDGEVVAGLGGDHVVAVLPLEDFLSAILNQILVASYLERQDDLRLGFGGRDVEGNAVKVRDCLVDVCGGGAIVKSASIASQASKHSMHKMECIPGEALRQNRLDKHVLVVEKKHGDSLAGLCSIGGCLRSTLPS